MFHRVVVSGDSMLPTLRDGDVIICKKPRSLRPGLIYVVNHIDLGRIVKRLERFDNRGRAQLTGDNPSSTPDAVLGVVEAERLTHRAWLRVGPRGISLL